METENFGAVDIMLIRSEKMNAELRNIKAIAEYIRNQLQEDLAYEQMSIKELVDPFTGEPVRASKK